jgi:hypothetical protein
MQRVTAEQEKNDKCRTKLSSEPTEGFHNTTLKINARKNKTNCLNFRMKL